MRRVHRAPAYGLDPWGWLEGALRVSRREGIDVLFPTQEQVAILSRAPDRLDAASVRTAVPSFEALRRVQDKISATRSLARIGLPMPETSIASPRSSRRSGPIPSAPFPSPPRPPRR